MAKRIFKITGIVLGVVIAFVGAIVGVLALMGKLKTPDVEPDVLRFESDIRIIDTYKQLDDYTTNDLYSFVLTGTNSKEEFADYEVNQTNCDIWFVGNVGSNLIQLCDENGVALTASKGLYRVECNKPIYYKIVPLFDVEHNIKPEVANVDGKVMLQARSESKNAQSNVLTIWIDRQINSVSVEDTNKVVYSNNQWNQTIQIPTDMSKEISYVINPEKSKHPISKESEKIVELYFDDRGYEEDYILVSPETIKSNAHLAEIVAYDDESDKYYFLSRKADNYNFVLATFPTYAAKEAYEANPETANLEGFERLQHMLTTVLTVKVVNSNITGIDLGENITRVTLNLYSQSDYITLNGNGYYTDAMNNDLGLTVNADGGVNDFIFSSATFNTIKAEKVNYEELDFKQTENQNSAQLSYSQLTALLPDSFVACLDKSNVVITAIDKDSNETKQLTLINGINGEDSKKYHCTNGVLAITDAFTPEFYILDPGMYLDFFTYKDSQYITATNNDNDGFDREVSLVPETENTGRNKTWKVISKTIPTADIRLGVMVINVDGVFNSNNFFKQVVITVSPVDLEYNTVADKQNIDLSVKFNSDGSITQESLSFDEFVTDVKGSYNALVLVTGINALPESGNYNVKSDYGIDVTSGDESICINDKDGMTYRIVGYFKNGEFVNDVMINNGAYNCQTKISLLQLEIPYELVLNYEDKDSYVENLTTIIKEIYEDPEFDRFPCSILIKDFITITPKVELNNELISNIIYEGSTKVDGNWNVYQMETEQTITIGSSISGMWDSLNSFYNSDLASHFVSSNSSNLQITSVTVDSNIVTLKYKAKISSETPITITITGLSDEDYELDPIKILSAIPEKIEYSDGVKEIALASYSDNIETSNTYLEIKVGHDGSNYTQTLKLTDGEQTIDSGIKFNITAKGGADYKWFRDEAGFKIEHNVTYTSLNLDVFTVATNSDEAYLTAVTTGIGVLKVDIGGIDAFLKVVVVTDGGFAFNGSDGGVIAFNAIHSKSHTYTTPFTLGEIVHLNHSNTAEDLITKAVNIKNVQNIYYANGDVEINEGIDTIVIKEKDSGNSILNIDKDGTGAWSFTRGDQTKYIPLTIKFAVVSKAGEITINLTLESNTKIEVNYGFWQSKTIYAGTEILLYQAASDINDIKTNPLIKVQTGGSHVEIKPLDGGDVFNQIHTFNTVGQLDLAIYIDKAKIQEIEGFNVVPNVVATYNNSYEFESNKEAAEDISNAFTLKSFDAGIVYGNYIDTSDTLKGCHSYYDVNKKLNPTEPLSLSLTNFTIVNNDGYIISENGTFTVKWNENLNETINTNIELKYKDSKIDIYSTVDSELRKFTALPIEIKNSISPTEAFGRLQTEVIDGVTYYQLMALTEYNSIVTVTDFDLVDASYAGADISVESNTIYIDAISEPLEVATLTLTFSDGTKTLFYTHNCFDIVPYKPSLQSNPVAITNNDFDFLNGILNISNIPSKVESITINGIYFTNSSEENIAISDQNNESNKHAVICSFKAEQVYIQGRSHSLNGFTKKINDRILYSNDLVINDKCTYYVEYTIKYEGLAEGYTFREKFEIDNRQKVVIQYPETISTTLSTLMLFEKGYNADGECISGKEGVEIDTGISFNVNKDINYEAILLYTNRETTINFKYDEIKHVSRASVSDGTDIAEIVCMAQVNMVGGYGFENVSVDMDTYSVTFNKAASRGVNGYFIFKITSESGAFGYYYVYVYCAGSNNLDSSNNLEIAIQYNRLATMHTVGDVVNNSDFYTKFNVANDSNISFYVLSATALGSLEEYVIDKDKQTRYSLLDLTNGITIINTNDEQSKYLTITLGVLYSNNIEIYSVGIITLYVKPTNYEFFDPLSYLTPEKVKPTIDTGVYTATISNNIGSVASPITVGGNLMNSVTVDSKHEAVVTDVTGGTITLTRVLDNDYTFVALYEYDGLVIKVIYTYKATKIPNENVTAVSEEIGEFAETTGFDMTYEIAEEILGNYSGTIKVQGVELLNTVEKATPATIDSSLGLKYYYAGGKFVLVFTPSYKSQTIPLTFTYVGLNNITRIFLFDVIEGIKIEDSSNSGTNPNAPIKTTVGSIDYTKSVGSTLTLKANEKSSLNYRCYEIGGRKIYTYGTDSFISISFVEAGYVLVDDTSATVQTDPFTLVKTDIGINFVHLAEEKPLTMLLDVKFDNSNSFSKYKAIGVYLTVQQTYSGIKSVYLTKNTDHENVLVSSAKINIFNELFKETISNVAAKGEVTTNINNSRRIVLLGLDGNPVASCDFEVMGFNTNNNPNKMRFNQLYREEKDGGITFDDDYTTMEFTNISNKNIPATLIIANNAGVGKLDTNGYAESSSVEYKYQILSADSSKLDELKLSNDDGLIGTYTSGKYISYVSYLTDMQMPKELMVGTLRDENNIKSFYLTEATITLPNGSSATALVDLSTTDEPFTKTFKLYDSGNQYELRLTFNSETHIVTCKLVKGELSDGQQVTFKISLYGTSSNIERDLKLVFTNLDITSNYPTTADKDVYAGYNVSLKEKLNRKDNDFTGITLDLNKENSVYTVAGNATQVTSDETNLFNYDKSNMSIKTKSVGTVGNQKVTAKLLFDVYYKEIVIKQVTYVFDVNRNLQILVNGNALNNETIYNDNLTTNFYITNKEAGENLSTATDFGRSLVHNFIGREDVVDSSILGGTQFKELIIDLYEIQNEFEISTKLEKDFLKISLYSNHSDYVNVDNNGITFKKDFNGEIELLVEVTNVHVGSYYAIWTINVHGIREFKYANDVAPNEPLKNVNDAFTSGTTVKLANNTTTGEKGVGIISTRGTTYYDGIDGYISSGTVDVDITGKYIKYNNENSTNEELFNQGSDFTVSKTNYMIDETSTLLEVTLPNVPSSSQNEPQTYLVIYKIKFSYLGDETDYFYVSYLVINYASVAEVSTNSTVDLDIGLVEKDSSRTFLDLFYYSETWSSATLTYEPVGTTPSYQYVITHDSKKYYDDGTAAADETLRTYKSTGVDSYFKFDAVINKLEYYENATATAVEINRSSNTDKNTLSLFKSSFNNMASYKEFIDSVMSGYIEISDKPTNRTYKLTYIADGSYGIDLSKNKDGTSYSSGYIKNELVGEFAIVIGGIRSYTIPAYDETTRVGFRLTTSQKLTVTGTTVYNVHHMFIAEEITPAAHYTIKDILTTRVLGIVDSTTSTATLAWVSKSVDGAPQVLNTTNGDSVESLGASIAEIKVKNGLEDDAATPEDESVNIYNLHPVVYKGGGLTSALYSLSETFYVLKVEADGVTNKIFTRTYQGVNATDYFQVPFVNSLNSQSLNLSNGAFKVYSMDIINNCLTVEIVDTGLDFERITASHAAAADSISIDSTHLINYKAANPLYQEYLLAQYKVECSEISGVSLLVNVAFTLPKQIQTVPVYYNGSNIVNSSGVATDPTIDFGSGKTFNNMNLSDIRTIEPASQHVEYFTSFDETSGKIVLNKDKVKDYLNVDDKVLEIQFTATMNDGRTYDFVVVVIANL